jgi:hypothetical protein
VARRIVLALLTLAVLLPSAALAGTGFSCSVDGQLHRACCCPAKTKHRPPAPATQLRAECCTLASSAPAIPPPATTLESPRLDTPGTVAIVASVPATPRWIHVVPAPRALAPPPLERSLFARHCALLL